MTVMQPGGSAGARPQPSGLADVIDTILDKGLVIDAYVRVSLVGIELLTIDARIVIASVDTYLRFAEATNRLDLVEHGGGEALPDFIHDLQEGGASGKVGGAVKGVKKALSSGSGDDDEDEVCPRRARKSSSSSSRRRSSQ